MSEFLPRLSDLSVEIFAIASMAWVGLRYTLREILAPLGRFWAVVLALVANFVAVPMLAFVILHVIELNSPYAIGLVLVASAAGAPFVIKLTHLSGGDVLLLKCFAPRVSGLSPLLGLATNISLVSLVTLAFALNLPAVECRSAGRHILRSQARAEPSPRWPVAEWRRPGGVCGLPPRDSRKELRLWPALQEATEAEVQRSCEECVYR